MVKSEIPKLRRESLIREVYRTLLYSARSYAAFDEKRVFPLVENLACRKEILDPMSGYGSLMLYCARIGIKAYCVEFSVPLYLWHVLIHPANNRLLADAVVRLRSLRRRWPTTSARAAVSASWFPENSKRLIVSLLHLIQDTLTAVGCDSRKTEERSLAILLPFVGRLSSSVPGNVTTHVKMGGICVYRNWHGDWDTYLKATLGLLIHIEKASRSRSHIVRKDDCRTVALPKRRFRAMITSPPYPNHRDFFSMFAPENECLSWLANESLVSLPPPVTFGIGSNVVSGRNKPNVRCESALRFLSALEHYQSKRRAKAQYDNRLYYIPYFSRYFSDLEKAYANIAKCLDWDFVGYIIVVNNTTRNQVIPVCESTLEMWRKMGFNAEVADSHETFHIGTKNPRAKGFKAKHTEYLIRVWHK